MSIEDEIVDKVERKMLYPLIPKAAGTTIRRAMFIGEDLWATLNAPPGENAEWEDRIGRLQADLEVFVTEQNITPSYLFLLCPSSEAVWEIRSVRDQPSLRVLGLFPLKDTFVSTNLAKREDLGGWQSRAWVEVKKAARAIWRKLFSTYRPIETKNINDVCSGAIGEIFYKDRS